MNGGRGAGSSIPALINKQGLHVTSVVNAYDDGKSTGEIRRFFNMLGPSDIRKVQELMLPKDDPDYENNLKLFQYRFPEGYERGKAINEIDSFVQGNQNHIAGITLSNTVVADMIRKFLSKFLDGLIIIEKVENKQLSFSDCSIMNCIYAGAFLVFERNIEEATLFIDHLFKLRGTVLPTNIENKKLAALRTNGEVLYSEAEIVELRSNVRIENIFLLDKDINKNCFDSLDIESKRKYLHHHHCFVAVSPYVRLAIEQADIIIYSSGTQHSSLYPTYMSIGLTQAIADNARAFKVFITNIGEDYETPAYMASDYINGAFRYLNQADSRSYSMNELFDVNLINSSSYKSDETYVEFDKDNLDKLPVNYLVDVYESMSNPGKHDGNKVIDCILNCYEQQSNIING